MSNIPATAITSMKPDKFSQTFDADKLTQFSADQVAAITPDMVWTMDVKQLIALETVVNGTTDANATEIAANRTAKFKIDIPLNTSVKDLPTFVEVRNLKNDSACMSGMSFGGQEADLLDTTAKQDAFAATLDVDTAAFFDRLRSSAGGFVWK